MGARKLFAVKKSGKGKRRRDDSDDMDSIREVIFNIDASVHKILEVTGKINLPVGFVALLLEAFSCKICQSIITPPAIYSRCYKALLGCQGCVDHWYRGDEAAEKKCPLCRGDRGYCDTSVVNGLGDFLRAAERMVNGDISSAPSSPPSI